VAAIARPIRFSVVVACVCFALVALAVTQFKWLPKQMFPLSERNQFLIYMDMPDGTDISQTETSPSYSAGLEFELTGVAQGVELA
jgi:multidrug efflux pump subunit AcrB